MNHKVSVTFLDVQLGGAVPGSIGRYSIDRVIADTTGRHGLRTFCDRCFCKSKSALARNREDNPSCICGIRRLRRGPLAQCWCDMLRCFYCRSERSTHLRLGQKRTGVGWWRTMGTTPLQMLKPNRRTTAARNEYFECMDVESRLFYMPKTAFPTAIEVTARVPD